MIKTAILPPTEQEVQEICRIINTNLGFNYTSQKKYLIESRLNKRLLQLGLDDYQKYLALLQEDPLERDILFELLTTNVTYFFRESAQFDYLAGTVLPRLAGEKKGRKRLRCWSAGCSSGEEAYSIAITCLETLGPEWDVKVLATDISAERLQIGSEGFFQAAEMDSIPEKWRRKYFVPHDPEDGCFRVLPELRSRVVFRMANLLDEASLPGEVRLDIIFCRNVFIYLSKESRGRILNHFHLRLNSGGYLFLGHSESINTSSDTRWFSEGKSIYRKR